MQGSTQCGQVRMVGFADNDDLHRLAHEVEGVEIACHGEIIAAEFARKSGEDGIGAAAMAVDAGEMPEADGGGGEGGVAGRDGMVGAMALAGDEIVGVGCCNEITAMR